MNLDTLLTHSIFIGLYVGAIAFYLTYRINKQEKRIVALEKEREESEKLKANILHWLNSSYSLADLKNIYRHDSGTTNKEWLSLIIDYHENSKALDKSGCYINENETVWKFVERKIKESKN